MKRLVKGALLAAGTALAGPDGSTSVVATTPAAAMQTAYRRVLFMPTLPCSVESGRCYLMPVMAMPRTKWRCNARKTSRTGMTTMTEPAIRSP